MRLVLKLLIVGISITTLTSCKKHNYLCWNDCLGNKLGNYTYISGVWINDVDYTSSYLSIDSLPKRFSYNHYSKRDNAKYNTLNNDQMMLTGLKTNIRDTIYEIGINKDCSLEKNGSKIFFNNLKFPPHFRFLVFYAGTNRPFNYLNSPHPNYYPFMNSVFSFDVDYYEITEIKRNYIMLEYDVNNNHVKIKISK